MSGFNYDTDERKVQLIVRTIQDELTAPPKSIRHDYAKGAWFEMLPAKTSVEIDLSQMNIALPSALPFPEQIDNVHFERTGPTTYQATLVQAEERNDLPETTNTLSSSSRLLA